jgi:DNA-binding NarL/FixJ family response regulator
VGYAEQAPPEPVRDLGTSRVDADHLVAIRDATSAVRLGDRVPQPLADTAPLVILMDVRMPGPVNGIEATRLLVNRRVDVGVIIFTAFPGTGIEQAARDAGAVEVLTKGCPAATILDAVGRAWSGMVPVDA